MSAFEQEWTNVHGEAPPLAFVLRQILRKPWVRFHALPNSVRYATGEIERDEVQQRAIILGDELFGDGSPCWLVECRIEEHSKHHWKPFRSQSGPQLRYRDRDDDFHWVASASPVLWEAAKFQGLLRDIADDRTGPTLWFGRKSGKVFAPYDGGFDIFPTTMADVFDLKKRHSAWLSTEPSGL